MMIDRGCKWKEGNEWRGFKSLSRANVVVSCLWFQINAEAYRLQLQPNEQR